MNTDNLNKIKLLREKTGVSIIECKKALLNNNFDLEKAILNLREKGILKASLKSIKDANQGLIHLQINEIKKNAILLELNCETDFVAKSEEFQNFAQNISDLSLKNLNTNLNASEILESHRINLITKLGENIVIKRIKKLNIENGYIFGYVHTINNNSKIASLIIVDIYSENHLTLYNDLCMQIVAMNPKYLTIENIPEEKINEEKILNKNIKKFLQENVLMEQLFIKDQTKTIKTIIENKFNILNFTRFEVGENLA